MASVVNVDAIEFFRDGKRNIRVYYQFGDEDKTIRESCYHQDYGWFVRGDGVVTVRAKKNSPIAVTRWTADQGGPTQIRVFFLDEQDSISQCQGDHEMMGQQWTYTTVEIAGKTEIAPGSHLAIARPDKDDQLLRLFYQGKKRSDATDETGAPLCEIRYDASGQEWVLQDNIIIGDAINATRLSAVSHKLNQDVRLYYQGSDMQLREMYCRDYQWSDKSQVIQRQHKLIERAPISAICWTSDQSKLQIRVFTVPAANENIILQMAYNHPDWRTVRGPAVSGRGGSGIGSCRDTGTSTTGNSPICVFYHPGLCTIELRSIPADDSSVSKQLANEIPHPVGIPMSLGGAVQISKGKTDKRPDARPTDRPGEQPTTMPKVGGEPGQGAIPEMPNSTRIAATRFYDPQTKKIYMRVVYQNKNNDFLETSFDSDNGWHTRSDQVVVSGNTVTAGSPIAVTSWDAGRETRVYYLDSSKKICERVRSTASAEAQGTWQDGKNIPATAASTSQLAVARTGTGDSNIRLFYQNDEDKIQEIMFKGMSGKWSKATTLVKAHKGTGLTAIVTKPPSGGTEVRLYCQDLEKKLMEYYMSPNLQWSQRSIQAEFGLVPGASISAVNWNADLSPTSLNLQIRVLSFDAEGDLIAMSFDQNNDGWDDTPAKVAINPVKAATVGTNVVAAVQGPDSDGIGRVDVFYQPVGMIGQLTSKTPAFNVLTPSEMGIVVLNAAECRRILDAFRETQLVDGHDAQYWKNAYDQANKECTSLNSRLQLLYSTINSARSSAKLSANWWDTNTGVTVVNGSNTTYGLLAGQYRQILLQGLLGAALVDVKFNGDYNTFTTWTATDQKLP